MSEMRGVERIWFSDDAVARAARLALAPLEVAYAGGVALRGSLYDLGLLPSHVPVLPALSVGNLTVGGTGKTPVSAWLATELAARGARPAIVLRGYGADEPLVHQRLNPGMVVIVSPDRLRGIERAAIEGADIAVLDDAFQHRRSRRAADVVLISADRWGSGRGRRLLPAGPWREPLGALRRASLVMVTRKAAPLEVAQEALNEVGLAAPGVPTTIVHLALGEMRRVDPEDHTAPVRIASLEGRNVIAISAIGDSVAFVKQLIATGAIVHARSFPDHHSFTAEEAARLGSAAALMDDSAGRREDAELPLVICTLKDAVKLAPLWPREALPLWYVSQQPILDSGRSAVDSLLSTMLSARHRQP